MTHSDTQAFPAALDRWRVEPLAFFGAFPLEMIFGGSAEMKPVIDRIRAVAGIESSALVCGEPGTGKGLVAKAIHYLSERRDRPIVAVDCAAIPGELLEAELFGRVQRGANGVSQERRGLFDRAEGGTILLHGIGEIAADVQSKLLRVLYESELCPVGSESMRRVDVRVIAATSRDVDVEVRHGRIRKDLFYRLSGFRINVPALRDRIDDVPRLAAVFCRIFANRTGKRIEGIEPEFLEKLTRYSWPENVRELKHAIESAVAVANGPTIGTREFPAIREKVAQFHRRTRMTDVSFHEARDAFEREYLTRLLQHHGHNLQESARVAGLELRELRMLLRKYDLTDDPESESLDV